MTNKRWSAVIAMVMAASAAWSSNAFAEDGKTAGDIMLRVRGLLISPDVTSSVSVIGGQVAASKTAVPEFDASYFVTNNIALELIAATNRHPVKDLGSTAGAVDLGKVTLLPPTLTVQYHFLPQSSFSPYVGAGLNYTFFYDAKAPGTTVKSITYDNNVGFALQVGFDYRLMGNWYANVDLKKLFLETHAHINGGAITGDVHLDPWIVGTGIGYKF